MGIKIGFSLFSTHPRVKRLIKQRLERKNNRGEKVVRIRKSTYFMTFKRLFKVFSNI